MNSVPDDFLSQIVANVRAGNSRFASVAPKKSPSWGASWSPPRQPSQEWTVTGASCICGANEDATSNRVHIVKLSGDEKESLAIIVGEVNTNYGPFVPSCELVEACDKHGVLLCNSDGRADSSMSVQDVFLAESDDAPRFLAQSPTSIEEHDVPGGWLTGGIRADLRRKWLSRICAWETDESALSLKQLSSMQFVLFQELGRPWRITPWLRLPYGWTMRGQWLLIYLVLCRAVRRRQKRETTARGQGGDS